MKCPGCGTVNHNVVRSVEGKVNQRWRACPCGGRWRTNEVIERGSFRVDTGVLPVGYRCATGSTPVAPKPPPYLPPKRKVPLNNPPKENTPLSQPPRQQPLAAVSANAMIAVFCAEYPAVYPGEKYTVSPKDAGQVALLVKAGTFAADMAGWRSTVKRYLASPKAYYVDARHSLSLLVGNVNEFTGEAKRPTPSNGVPVPIRRQESYAVRAERERQDRHDQASLDRAFEAMDGIDAILGGSR